MTLHDFQTDKIIKQLSDKIIQYGKLGVHYPKYLYRKHTQQILEFS